MWAFSFFFSLSSVPKLLWWLPEDGVNLLFLNPYCFNELSSCGTQVVDARGRPSLKTTVKSKKVKSISRRARPSQIRRVQKELKRHSKTTVCLEAVCFCLFWFVCLLVRSIIFKSNLLLSPFSSDSDAHSTTSSASPAQSPSYSNQSDEGSDTELAPGSSRSPVFSFLDLTYWKRSVCAWLSMWRVDGKRLVCAWLSMWCVDVTSYLIELVFIVSVFYWFQAKGLLWHHLQRPLWRGLDWPPSLQTLLPEETRARARRGGGGGGRGRRGGGSSSDQPAEQDESSSPDLPFPSTSQRGRGGGRWWGRGVVRPLTGTHTHTQGTEAAFEGGLGELRISCPLALCRSPVRLPSIQEQLEPFLFCLFFLYIVSFISVFISEEEVILCCLTYGLLRSLCFYPSSVFHSVSIGYSDI